MSRNVKNALLKCEDSVYTRELFCGYILFFLTATTVQKLIIFLDAQPNSPPLLLALIQSQTKIEKNENSLRIFPTEMGDNREV